MRSEDCGSRAPWEKASPPLTLIVVGDPPVRSTLVPVVEDHGFLVVTAADAVTAFEKLAEHPKAALLLIDVGLPGKVNVFAAVAAEHRPDTPILQIWGHGESEEEVMPDEVRFLGKPFASEHFLAAVEELLAG